MDMHARSYPTPEPHVVDAHWSVACTSKLGPTNGIENMNADVLPPVRHVLQASPNYLSQYTAIRWLPSHRFNVLSIAQTGSHVFPTDRGPVSIYYLGQTPFYSAPAYQSKTPFPFKANIAKFNEVPYHHCAMPYGATSICFPVYTFRGNDASQKCRSSIRRCSARASMPLCR